MIKIKKKMKSTFVKFAIFAIILGSFSLQSFSPGLPDVTTVKVTDLYWIDAQNVHHNYYAAKVSFWGPIVTDVTGSYSTNNITITGPNTTEYFPTGYQHYYVTGGNLSTAQLSVKVNSNSAWELLGGLDSNSCMVTRYMSGNYMYVMEFSRGAVAYNAPIEE